MRSSKRYLSFVRKDGTCLMCEITKFVTVDLGSSGNRFHLDELKDGTFRLTVDSKFISDMSQIEMIDFIRED